MAQSAQKDGFCWAHQVQRQPTMQHPPFSRCGRRWLQIAIPCYILSPFGVGASGASGGVGIVVAAAALVGATTGAFA